MKWRLLPYTVGAPAWNMALDEAIFISYRQGLAPPTLRFYGWNPPALSVGYFQDVRREVNLAGLAQKTPDLYLARSQKGESSDRMAQEKDRAFFLQLARLAKKTAFLDLARRALHHHGRAR